jgi:ABC-type multidrug transport system fused ATPase/permease subunit
MNMADLDRVAVRVSDGLRKTLSRINTLALGIVGITATIGLATFLTGLWIFDGSQSTWSVIGGALCFAPTFAALLAWFYVRTTVRAAPALQNNVRKVLDESNSTANVLINYDTGERLSNTAKTFGNLSIDLRKRRKELPALWAGVRAITSVPGLVAIALLGTLAVGALGTILLIGGLID